MASDGNYILTNDPGTTHTDTAFSYKILTSGTMTGVTYSFNWEFSCNGVTTKKTVATGLTATTYSWTPTTAEFGPLMKKSSSGSLKIIVKTENGRLVQQVREFTLKLNTSIKPTISNMTLVRTNGFNGRSVSNITTHKLSFGVSGLYGAAQTVNVHVGDTTYTKEVAAKSNNAATTVTVDIGTFDTGSSDTLVKNIFITSNDTRGCTGTQYISFTVYKYTAPNVKVSIARNSNEKPVLTFDATYQSTVAGAANTLKTFYARCIVGSTVNDTDLKDLVSPKVLNGTYEITKSYEFIICLQDSVNPVAFIKKVKLPSVNMIMDIGADGKTIAFFGVAPSTAEKESLLIGERAVFGEDVILGLASERNTMINDNGLIIRNGSTIIGQIGYGSGKDSNGNFINSPFYTLGTRKTDSKIGIYSVSNGFNVEASGAYSSANGFGTKASGAYSVANGHSTEASGEASRADGNTTKASGSYSSANGFNTEASGYASRADGSTTKASGYASQASGFHSEAKGSYSFADGYYTKASSAYQTAIGKYNVEDTASKYLLMVGNGSSDTARSNAFCVNTTGAIEVRRGVWIGSNNQGLYGMFTDKTNTELALVTSGNALRYGYGAYEKGTVETILYGGNALTFALKSPSASWKPYITKGTSITIKWTGAGYITSAGKEINFTISFGVPIVGVSAVSITSSTGLIVRQNRNYLYGGSASATVKPSSYIGIIGTYEVQVKVNMTNTTNVINNSPCGIDASLTFTFS